ncbi:MAG TPA: aminotransferase class I/II-fold pyridoxal phosphate-dependent enzyme [Vitreimonas sp.]|nr:aminotransferase class I/II-fold pyridoxal phosphate-dependent enzyme [Vitreimonas sp.]
MSSSDPSAGTDRIALAEPTIGGNAARYLEACLATNMVSSVGPFVDRFESAFASAVGARHAVACGSGTAALHLAMRVLDIGPGDEVFVPTLTFVASANPVRYVGGSVVLVDSEAVTRNLDPALVADELDRRARAGLRQPKAIEVVHLVGHPAELEPILAAADRHGVAVIEDAAEALGATYRGGSFDGRQVGTVGRIGCFSFNGNKLITTGGGGMVVTDDEALAARARHLSTQARLPGRAYDHDQLGYNYRLSNLAAALGLAQLEQLPDLLAARRTIAARYDEAIAAIPWLEPAPRATWADPSFWLYTAAVRPAGDAPDRDGLIDALAAAGIDARPIWTPLHRTRLYADVPRLGGSVAEDLFRRAVSLPSSSSLGEARQRRVTDALRGAENVRGSGAGRDRVAAPGGRSGTDLR